MYRFFSQMKAKGASWDEHTGTKCTSGGSGCYGAGDGGRINARLVKIKADGTPDLSSVLAQETIDPRTRYFETKSAYGVSAISLFWYFNMGGVQLKANTPYAMVYRNVHPDPAHNFSSTNSLTVKESEAGPNGRNNLDPNAPGAIAGLDPREAVAWTTNDGASWTWGRQVGHYFGSASSDDGTRLAHYAWQSSPTAKPESNQPYSSYWGTCTPCTLTSSSVPRRTTFTEAGGYAPVGKSVGVVTVRNLRTGQTGHTATLGSGIRRGALSPQVTVEVGDSYQITHTGTVYKGEADGYIVSILKVGSGAFPYNTPGQGADRAELFALPHPYYASAVAPPPADTTPPETTITSGPTGNTTATTASFGFGSSESGSSFQCRIDAGSFAACTSAQSYSGVAVGTHTFQTRATDAAGNVDPTPASRSWTVDAPPPPPADTTPPETTITSGPTGNTTATTASFGFGSSESGSSFQCRIDAGSFAACTSAQSYSGVAVGTHTFQTRATDAAGNVDPTPASRSWTVDAPPPPPADTTPPETTITSGPTGNTTATTASFGFGSSESGSSFQCRIDAGSFAACTSAKTYSVMSLGAHTFEVRATDGAGNGDLTPASRSWTVEAVPPPPPPDGTIVPPTADKAAGRIASASGVETALASATPGKAVDGSSTTRWSSKVGDGQWWQVDLGSIGTVDKVSVNWEGAYASRYRILTSTDGTTYTLAADVSISQQGWRTTAFSARQARYVKLEGVTRATPYGISFWDFRVGGAVNTPVEKAAGHPATASSVEAALPSATADKAVDGSSTTRWSSSVGDNRWWQVDLGRSRQVDKVTINWENAYASRYRIMTSTDGASYTQAADVSIPSAGIHTTTFASRNARYVKIEGVTRATPYGISFWEVQVFGVND